jgi:hypothetical protein
MKEEIEYGWRQRNDDREKKYGKIRDMAKDVKKIVKQNQLKASKGFKEWFLGL